jgi:FtsP/CotA-like multicopper oxidase with cupredoxin domain
VTHSDGDAVQPAETASIRLGMGERYDAIVTVAEGIRPVVAEASGRGGRALAVLRTRSGMAPSTDNRSVEFDQVPLTADRLRASARMAPPRRAPDATSDLVLSGSMDPDVWTINGTTYDKTEPFMTRKREQQSFHVHNMSITSNLLPVHG